MPPQAARSSETSPEGPMMLHAGNLSVGQNGELDRHLAALEQRRTCSLGNQVVPVHAHGLKHAREIRPEIDALRVTEDFEIAGGAGAAAASGAVVATSAAAAERSGRTAGAGRAGGLGDLLAGGLIQGAKIDGTVSGRSAAAGPAWGPAPEACSAPAAWAAAVPGFPLGEGCCWPGGDCCPGGCGGPALRNSSSVFWSTDG